VSIYAVLLAFPAINGAGRAAQYRPVLSSSVEIPVANLERETHEQTTKTAA
jgi:hypothetical protein